MARDKNNLPDGTLHSTLHHLHNFIPIYPPIDKLHADAYMQYCITK